MDINTISKELEEKFNCIVTSIFKYENTDFIKCIETLANGIKYRYFKIEKENIKEILDEEMLNYFRETMEIHQDVNY